MIFPEIDPVAFHLGPLAVRWYSLAYLFGFLLGWRYALGLADRDKDLRPTAEDIDGFLPWVVLGIIIGGRLGYVLFYNLQYYMDDPSQILFVWHGGMSFHGGMLGAVLMIFAYAKFFNIPVLRLGDLVCCVVPIGLFLGRIANFINGELFGRVTTAPWGIVFPQAGELPRHPSQLYEATLEGLVLFAVMFMLARKDSIRRTPGVLAGVFLAGYALARIGVEFFREADPQIGYFGGVTLGQILSLPMFAVGAGLAIYAWKNRKTETAKS